MWPIASAQSRDIKSLDTRFGRIVSYGFSWTKISLLKHPLTSLDFQLMPHVLWSMRKNLFVKLTIACLRATALLHCEQTRFHGVCISASMESGSEAESNQEGCNWCMVTRTCHGFPLKTHTLAHQPRCLTEPLSSTVLTVYLPPH